MDRRFMDYMMMNGRGRDYGDMARGRRGRRGGRRDKGMDYNYDERDYEYDSRRGQQGYSRDGRDYQSGRQSDMGYDYPMMRDGHYNKGGEGKTYYPIEAMGRFNGYWGMPEEDYRGRGRDYGDYNYDMRYDMRGRDYGYYYGGDYGEGLTKEELEHWKHKLMKEIEEKDKHFFTKENIEQKAKQMGLDMNKYNAEELLVATLMVYTDYCMALKPYIGANMDPYIKLADAFMMDKDSPIKGGEKLAVYYDSVIADD